MDQAAQAAVGLARAALPRVLHDQLAAVLLVDLTDRTVVFANPAARDLAPVALPLPIEEWSEAAGLVAPDGTPLSRSAGPLTRVAAGQPVQGEAVRTSGDGARSLWVTGFPFAPGQTVPAPALPDGLHQRAMVLLLDLADDTPHVPADPDGPDGPAGSESGSQASVRLLVERAVLSLELAVTLSDPSLEDNPLVWVNPGFTRITGYSAEEVVGHNCRFLQGPDTPKGPIDELRAAVAEQRATVVVLLNYRRDGTAFYNEVAVSPVLDPAGQLVNYVAVQTDVTARVALEAERESLHTAERQARQRAETEHARAQAAQRRLALLAEGTALLAATLDTRQVLDRLTELVVPLLADACLIDLLDEGLLDEGLLDEDLGDEDLGDGDVVGAVAAGVAGVAGVVRPAASAHRDATRAPLLTAMLPDRPLPLQQASLARQVLRSGTRHLLDPWPPGTGVLQPALAAEQARALAELAPLSGVVIPLRARRRLLGTLTLLTTAAGAGGSDRRLSADDAELAEDLARRAALVLDNVRLYDREHQAAATLQRSLLPRLPRVRGLELAARYVPAARAAEVGGDWYDAFTLADGSTAVVIGDVVGHDLAAAARMGRIRNLLRGCAYDAPGPAAALQRLDQVTAGLAGHPHPAAPPLGSGTRPVQDVEMVDEHPDDQTDDETDDQTDGLGDVEVGDLATATLVRLTPSAGATQLTWSNAGHPPPLLLAADGGARFLAADSDPLLGVGPGVARADHVAVLPPGATLLLYTDGLVERRGSDLDSGLAALLAGAAALAVQPLEQLCDALLAALGSAGDDVALLAVRPRPARRPRASAAGGVEARGRDRDAAALRPGGPDDADVDSADLDGADRDSAGLDSARVLLAAAEHPVRAGRHHLRRWAEQVGLDPETTYTLCLLASELLSNAEQHGGSGIDLHVQLRHHPAPGATARVRVSVADGKSRLPVLQPRDDAALDGRGLAIIDAVAADWGSHPTELGKVVWFELDARLPVPRT